MNVVAAEQGAGKNNHGPGVERWRALVLFSVTVFLVTLTDQATKILVAASLPNGSGRELVPGVLNLVHTRNPGAAFGMMSGSAPGLRSLFFIGISVMALIVILWLVTQSPRIRWPLLMACSTFFGGTLGNLLDRIRFGEVVDFIDLHVGAWHWPAFNVADSALCVGTACFILHFFTERKAADTE